MASFYPFFIIINRRMILNIPRICSILMPKRKVADVAQTDRIDDHVAHHSYRTRLKAGFLKSIMADRGYITYRLIEAYNPEHFDTKYDVHHNRFWTLPSAMVKSVDTYKKYPRRMVKLDINDETWSALHLAKQRKTSVHYKKPIHSIFYDFVHAGMITEWFCQRIFDDYRQELESYPNGDGPKADMFNAALPVFKRIAGLGDLAYDLEGKPQEAGLTGRARVEVLVERKSLVTAMAELSPYGQGAQRLVNDLKKKVTDDVYNDFCKKVETSTAMLASVRTFSAKKRTDTK